MTGNDWNLEELGNTIDAIIDQAVSSQNYQNFNQSIRQAVDKASDHFSSGAAVEGKPSSCRSGQSGRRPGYQPNINIYSSKIHYANVPDCEQMPQVSTLYQNVDKKVSGNAMYSGLGAFLLGFGLIDVLGALIKLGPFVGFAGLCGIGVGGWLLAKYSLKRSQLSRFQKYVAALGGKTYADLKLLARAVGKSVGFVRKDLKKMIDEGLFLEGHMDDTETSLITSNETFTHYLELRQKQAEQAREEEARTVRRQQKDENRKVSAEVQEVLDKGNAFLIQIRDCNDKIPGREISQKISRMESIIEKIFDRAETNPEIIPKLKKLMDYYLPMTVKLLNAYADMDAQPVEGDTIRKSKQEIEAALDTLNDAFEKLLDSVFQETAMDVSSDISVLQSLLAQEGLTEDGISSAVR